MNIKLTDEELKEALQLWVTRKFTLSYIVEEVYIHSRNIKITIKEGNNDTSDD